VPVRDRFGKYGEVHGGEVQTQHCLSAYIADSQPLQVRRESNTEDEPPSLGDFLHCLPARVNPVYLSSLATAPDAAVRVHSYPFWMIQPIHENFQFQAHGVT